MGDIDFDELDKAVNSLMSGGGPAKKPASSQQSAPTPTAPPTQRLSVPSRRAAMPTPVAKQPSPLLSKDTSKSVVAPTAVRKAGRFMDVVDPSADLNPMKRPMPSVAPSRSAQPLPKPTIPQVEEPTIIAAPDTSSTLKTVTDSPSESVTVRRVAKNENMPDPLDSMQLTPPVETPAELPSSDAADDERPAAAFSGLAQKEESTVPNEPAVNEKTDTGTILADLSNAIQAQLGGVVPATRDSSASSTESTTDKTPTNTDDPAIEASSAEQPMIPIDTPNEVSDIHADSPQGDSPFLANARPEKRPLNAPLVADVEDIDESEPSSVAANELEKKPANAPPVANDETKSHDGIHELSHELVKIEATGRMTDDEPVQPTGGSIPLGVTTALATSTSISQQYVQKESTGDTSHAPIYDTADYEKTLQHPAKKQSGWWMVLGVLVLLALGSGGAVALYVMGIIP